MSTIHRCDICHKHIKSSKNIMIWGGAIPSLDICVPCWLDPSKWPQIHEVKSDK